MMGLMKYVLCDKDESDIAMMTAFCKQITHKCTGIRVVQQVIQYEMTLLTPRVFKIESHAFVITDVQIYRVQLSCVIRGPFTKIP